MEAFFFHYNRITQLSPEDISSSLLKDKQRNKYLFQSNPFTGIFGANFEINIIF